MIYKIINRSKQNTQFKKCNQKNMEECDKRKSHISIKLHMLYIKR